MVFAYIDPGTSATLMQVVLAGTAGLAAAGKLMFGRLRRRRSDDAITPETVAPLTEDPAPSE